MKRLAPALGAIGILLPTLAWGQLEPPLPLISDLLSRQEEARRALGVPELPPDLAGRPAHAASEESAPAQGAGAQLRQITVDRSPENVLREAAKELGGTDATTNIVARFQRAATLGDWPAVGAILAELEPVDAGPVFDHLVQQLQAADSASSPRAGAPPIPQRPGAPPTRFLAPDDALALLEICPVELTDARMEALGVLLGRSLEGHRAIGPLIQRLEEGLPKIGGFDPAERRRAARLLISAGRVVEAERFLPPLDLDQKPRDFALLDAHATLLAARAKAMDGRQTLGERRERIAAAFELTEALLRDPDCPETEREAALGRAWDLLDEMHPDGASGWLRQVFQSEPGIGADLIARAARQSAQPNERAFGPRLKSLERQARAVQALLASVADLAVWRPMLEVLALGWAREAEFTKGQAETQQQPIQHFDSFGNVIGVTQPRAANPNQPQPIPAAALLKVAPAGRWLVEMTDSTALRMATLAVQLRIRAGEFQEALEGIEDLAKAHPGLARELVIEALNSWPEERQAAMPAGVAQRVVFAGSGRATSAIPLTRARQERNLDELAAMMDRIRSMPWVGLAPDPDVLVGAFTRAHSDAEVFKVEDIERVFGKLETLDPGILSELLQTMRGALAVFWRQPQIQQAAQTKRTDAEIAMEVGRGYDLVARIAEATQRRAPDSWQIRLARAATLYDWAEFDYGRQVDLAVYTTRRDEAFGMFESAAELYAAKVADMPVAAQSPMVYQMWFNATLGASDLSYLTRQVEPGTNQLARIRAAILALPGEAAERHLGAFGEALGMAVTRLRPELKPRYARAGLAIVGDHPGAAAIRALARHYEDLVREVILEARVDGDSNVGHTAPFGVFIDILHTDAVARESGGFARYLQNPGNRGYYYSSHAGGPPNYRDEFERQVFEKCADGFDVLSVTFHAEDTRPLGSGRPGWRRMPYACLLLKAKDSSVDRLPSFQLDMEFADGRGQVMLPIVSTPVLIDARSDEAPPRPARDIEVTQILDDRDLATGTVVLEIKATARGIVPPLESLFDPGAPGFRVVKTEDRGVSLARVEAEDEPVAVTERVWLLTLEVEPGNSGAMEFTFPRARHAPISVHYKRYADADLVNVAPQVALSGIRLRSGSRWPWILGAGVVALALAVWRGQRREGLAPAMAGPGHAMPSEVTPFSVLNLLRRIEADPGCALTADQRRELGQTISALQATYFARTPERETPPPLESVAEEWIRLTRRG